MHQAAVGVSRGSGVYFSKGKDLKEKMYPKASTSPISRGRYESRHRLYASRRRRYVSRLGCIFFRCRASELAILRVRVAKI